MRVGGYVTNVVRDPQTILLAYFTCTISGLNHNDTRSASIDNTDFRVGPRSASGQCAHAAASAASAGQRSLRRAIAHRHRARRAAQTNVKFTDHGDRCVVFLTSYGSLFRWFRVSWLVLSIVQYSSRAELETIFSNSIRESISVQMHNALRRAVSRLYL